MWKAKTIVQDLNLGRTNIYKESKDDELGMIQYENI